MLYAQLLRDKTGEVLGRAPDLASAIAILRDEADGVRRAVSGVMRDVAAGGEGSFAGFFGLEHIIGALFEHAFSIPDLAPDDTLRAAVELSGEEEFREKRRRVP